MMKGDVFMHIVATGDALAASSDIWVKTPVMALEAHQLASPDVAEWEVTFTEGRCDAPYLVRAWNARHEIVVLPRAVWELTETPQPRELVRAWVGGWIPLALLQPLIQRLARLHVAVADPSGKDLLKVFAARDRVISRHAGRPVFLLADGHGEPYRLCAEPALTQGDLQIFPLKAIPDPERMEPIPRDAVLLDHSVARSPAVSDVALLLYDKLMLASIWAGPAAVQSPHHPPLTLDGGLWLAAHPIEPQA